LRERPEDLPQLARHFVRRAARKMDKVIDAVPHEIMDALVKYPWPENIRKLENVIERAVILSPGGVLRVPVWDLRARLAPGPDCERSQTLEEVERKHILATLRGTRWVVSEPRGAANRLGLNRATLYFRMKKLGIVRPAPESHLRGANPGAESLGHSEFFAGELP
jgi:formate hydrogenlyase transcriptional activator